MGSRQPTPYPRQAGHRDVSNRPPTQHGMSRKPLALQDENVVPRNYSRKKCSYKDASVPGNITQPLPRRTWPFPTDVTNKAGYNHNGATPFLPTSTWQESHFGGNPVPAQFLECMLPGYSRCTAALDQAPHTGRATTSDDTNLASGNYDLMSKNPMTLDSALSHYGIATKSDGTIEFYDSLGKSDTTGRDHTKETEVVPCRDAGTTRYTPWHGIPAPRSEPTDDQKRPCPQSFEQPHGKRRRIDDSAPIGTAHTESSRPGRTISGSTPPGRTATASTERGPITSVSEEPAVNISVGTHPESISTTSTSTNNVPNLVQQNETQGDELEDDHSFYGEDAPERTTSANTNPAPTTSTSTHPEGTGQADSVCATSGLLSPPSTPEDSGELDSDDDNEILVGLAGLLLRKKADKTHMQSMLEGSKKRFLQACEIYHAQKVQIKALEKQIKGSEAREGDLLEQIIELSAAHRETEGEMMKVLNEHSRTTMDGLMEPGYWNST